MMMSGRVRMYMGTYKVGLLDPVCLDTVVDGYCFIFIIYILYFFYKICLIVKK